MKVVFIGASNFGLRCLQACHHSEEVEVVGIITARRHFSISYRPSGVTNVLHADLVDYASEYNIPIQTLTKSMKDKHLLDSLDKWKPDIFIVVGWYHMIPKTWFEYAPAYGLHASLLPDYSGGAPLVWAMINGESKTGITLFQIDEGVDSGPIVAQAEERILAEDTIATLYTRIEERGIEILQAALPSIAKGTLVLAQQDESKRRIMPQRTPDDGKIDWSQSAEDIIRFIRAQTKPYPGAFTLLNQQRIKIWSASLYGTQNSIQPGMVQRDIAGNYKIFCESGAIQLEEISVNDQLFSGAGLKEVFQYGGQILG